MAYQEKTDGLEPHPRKQLVHRDSNLRLIASPLVKPSTTSEPGVPSSRVSSMGLDSRDAADLEQLEFRYPSDHSCPEFIKHSASTNYELFYDLWFVANLEVFSSTKGISKESDLYTYVGYLTILWFTWFVVGLFDVRFVTDSIFERVIRMSHLGVMVGFSVVVSFFDPDKQEKKAFQTLSLILMVSRLTLVVQYSTIIWHVRRFKEGKFAVALAAAVHFVAAMIYLGITFRFREGQNSRVYLVWYIISAIEGITQLGLALYFKTLTVKGTHLTERMTVLTVIILGGGCTAIAKNVVLIVKNAAGWSTQTIGVLIAAISLMYFFFMIYFDWMNHHHLKGWRQVSWSILHFPFHVALLLFMEGATQFMIWWKCNEVRNFAYDQFNSAVDRLDGQEITSDMVSQSFNDTINSIFDIYPYIYTETNDVVDYFLTDIKSIPNETWYSDVTGPYADAWSQYDYDTAELIKTVINSLFASFKIDPFQDMQEPDMIKSQDEAFDSINEQFGTVFEYAYVTAGMVLMLMVIMAALTRKRAAWSPFIIFRSVLFFFMGIGMSLIVLIGRSEDATLNYLLTPWLVPTICIVFLVVLLLSHLPHPPPLFFRSSANAAKRQNSWGWRRGNTGGANAAYSSVQVREMNGSLSDVMVAGESYGHDYQAYNPQRWGNEVTLVQYPVDTSYHNAYGQSMDIGVGAHEVKQR